MQYSSFCLCCAGWTSHQHTRRARAGTSPKRCQRNGGLVLWKIGGGGGWAITTSYWSPSSLGLMFFHRKGSQQGVMWGIAVLHCPNLQLPADCPSPPPFCIPLPPPLPSGLCQRYSFGAPQTAAVPLLTTSLRQPSAPSAAYDWHNTSGALSFSSSVALYKMDLRAVCTSPAVTPAGSSAEEERAVAEARGAACAETSATYRL